MSSLVGVVDACVTPAFRTVAIHELRALRAERLAMIAIATLAIAIGYAELHSAAALRREQSTLAEYLRLEAKNVADKREQNAETWRRIEEGDLREIPEFTNDPALTPLFPYWEFQLQRSAVLPPSPLALLAAGQRDMYPMAYRPSAAGQFYKEVVPSAEQNDNPRHRMTGHFDPAFVTLYLLPLFIIAVSYDLLASERELGTLTLLLSQPVALHTVVGAKLAVRAGLLLTVTMALIVGGAVASGVTLKSPVVTLEFALWLGTVTVYAAVWFGIAACVNAFGRTAAANAVTLAVCWLLLVLLVPAVVRFTARVMYPIPPASSLRDVKRDAQLRVGVDLWEEGVKELDDPRSRSSRIVAEYLRDKPDLRLAENPPPAQPFAWTFSKNVRNRSAYWGGKVHQQRFHLMYSARTAAIKNLVTPAEREFDRQYARQHKLFRLGSFVSPQTLAERVLTTLSGTTSEQHDRFLRQVEDNQSEWIHYFTKRSLASEMLRPDDFDRFPYFVFQKESVSEVLRSILVPALVLVALAAVTLSVGLWSMLRYRIVG